MTPEEQGCYDALREDNDCFKRENAALRSRLAEETAIVDRIWDIYGRPTYEQLAGRSIYDLINADLARLAEVERLLQEVYDGRQSLMSVGLVYRIGHTLNHRTPDSASD